MYVISPDLLTAFKAKSSQFINENTGTRREENFKSYVEQNENQKCSSISKTSFHSTKSFAYLINDKILSPVRRMLRLMFGHSPLDPIRFWLLIWSYVAWCRCPKPASERQSGYQNSCTHLILVSFLVLYNIVENFVYFVDSNVLNAWSF